ncbi:hypothetical protein [Streptomyces sp. NPDC055287]
MTAPATTARRRTAGRAQDSQLRTSLRVDSWSTAAFGVVLLAGGNWLSGPLGLPVTWSVPFGIAMLGGAAALALIAGAPRIPSRPVMAVAVGNALSCVALLLIAFTGVVPLTGLGIAFMVVGAVVVAVFAGLEYAGHRRAGSAGPAGGPGAGESAGH